ncbi:hypothetical protein [Zongyangia hominis]|uniref:CYTH domain-containing protein n=1 Tax=Zongyangia hominis TaxID=2763677 RepID=A0A926ECQ5_9FIRM|nr:hypothetical protein [Zongyangia hominis]MBC8569352.1 hypothetical protein [Zongyangia hominis]
MEIERKFLIDDFPNLPEIDRAKVEQGYLSTCPVVRIRKKETPQGASYRLCFKGTGTLCREEIELDLEEDVYERLCRLLCMPPIRKDYRVYALPEGLRLECSLVDEGEEGAFFYAEVEFESVEQAHTFVPPAFLGRELTEVPGSSMSNFWERKKRRLGIEGPSERS